MNDNLEILRCPLFVPKNPKTLKRILHLLSFCFSSFFPLISRYSWKPKIIIHVTPTLFCSINTLLYAYVSGAKSILHIQDYEIDAMFGLSQSKYGLIKKIVFFFERKVYERYDYISTISFGMIKRGLEKGIPKKKMLLFPNWCELDHLSSGIYNNKILTKFGIPKNKKIILYSGNIGEKQGLEILLEAAKKLEKDEELQFLLVGDGSAKERLQSLSKNYSLLNISFLPLQPYELLPDMLATATIHIVIQKRGVADTMLPSKLTNILAVGGNAVITADEDTTLGELCINNPGIATLCKPECSDSLVDAIKESLSMSSPNLIAKNYANTSLDKNHILSQFIKVFKNAK